jgi:hypothetical protein
MTMPSDRDHAHVHAAAAGSSWRLMVVPLLGLLALLAVVVLAGG